ncbi:alpha-D-ribose 1-methylphosphonate 5-triphosphate diphosphatase [Psychromarinibacter sp. C21-152]|uniref:Alpha-D-ribose 1-methylphosphonate 5-triphosphate diphosphatase n=1 Tax=Psychromarinibacter sediminicola TaxID=3033385 RepID=A0AAE3NS92_9RHOB|nr:alpha-D-ribose 1-methylphosphonate 5-triphosphate diphosphatase [Psychromarinibacter sediminicola]
MAQELCLANAQLVLPDRIARGRVTLHGETIAEVEETAAVPAGALDCGGDYLIPGLVELHTDNLERHIQPRPGVDWPVAPAILAHDGELAATGITTVFDALRVGSVLFGKGRHERYARGTASELLRLRDRGILKISHFLHLRAEVCSNTLTEEMEEFGPADRVGLVSLMDHTPGQRQFRDVTTFANYLRGKRSMTDAEIDTHFRKLKDLRARFGDRHEAMAVKEAARYGAVLASHDDTTAEHVARSSDHGIRLAEFPTTVEAAEACRDKGIAIMMGAPNIIRGGSHSGNVSAMELAGMDLLDIVSSDYVPAALLLSAFRLGAFWDDLPRAIRTVSEAPARATGLTDRGRIEPGQRADLVRVHETDRSPVVMGSWSRGRRIA